MSPLAQSENMAQRQGFAVTVVPLVLYKHSAPRLADCVSNLPCLTDGMKWREQHRACVPDLAAHVNRKKEPEWTLHPADAGYAGSSLRLVKILARVQPLMKLLGLKPCAWGISSYWFPHFLLTVLAKRDVNDLQAQSHQSLKENTVWFHLAGKLNTFLHSSSLFSL